MSWMSTTNLQLKTFKTKLSYFSAVHHITLFICQITSCCSAAVTLLLLCPSRGAEYCDQIVCLSVCLSVRPRAYLWNRWTDLHKIFCADLLWWWLVPPMAALQYINWTLDYYNMAIRALGFMITSRLAVVGRMVMRGRLKYYFNGTTLFTYCKNKILMTGWRLY